MKAQWLKKPIFWLILAAVIALAIGLVLANSSGDEAGPGVEPINTTPLVFGPEVDDWVYDQTAIELDNLAQGVSVRSGFNTRAVSLDASDSIGLAVGGANDINNFRQNLANGYLPIPSDISHEGIFYDYFFETGPDEDCDQLFCPAYVTALSPDPLSGQPQHFLAVGLNSNIQAEDFERKKLNLVVVLDISGSMGSGFDSYYYDQFGLANPDPEIDEAEARKTKMEVANQSLVALLDQLNPEDRVGIVLFDDQAYVAKQLRLVGETDLAATKGHVLELSPQGGTNMEAGYRAGTELFAEYLDIDANDYENRIIFLTDAMPNIGSTDKYELAELATDNAKGGVYTSFIGVGVDFNTELIQAITQTEGANYFSVHSSSEFRRQLDEGFEYMVTPLVFDLNLKLEADGYDIKAVYGSPEADLATGEIMKVNTLFPSLRVDGQTRGGLVLLHLDKTSDNASLALTVSYRDRAGDDHENGQSVEFPAGSESHFAHTGIHKGVVLSRMVNVMKDWLRHQSQETDSPVVRPEDFLVRYRNEGIPFFLEPIDLGYWERTSRPLQLSAQYRSIMMTLRDYIAGEIESIGDDSLNQELDLIDKILAAPEN